MAREDFQPSDALPPTGQDRRPLAGIGYFLPMTVPKTTPYGDVGLSDIQMDTPQALKDVYSGIMKVGAAMRGELSPQEIQQLAFDTSMNVTGGTLLGSKLLPKAVPEGALGMSISNPSKIKQYIKETFPKFLYHVPNKRNIKDGIKTYQHRDFEKDRLNLPEGKGIYLSQTPLGPDAVKIDVSKLPIETLNDLKPTYQAEGYAVFRKDIPKEAIDFKPNFPEFPSAAKIPDDLNLGSGSLFSPEIKKGRKLLIVSCSADKCPDPGDMEAFDRYTGDMFKSIKKQGIPEENVDLAIMSAKYGLIRRDTKIPNYNVKMDKEIANNLLNDPTQVARIKNTIEGYDEVVVEGSDLYKSVIKEAAGDAPIKDFKLDFKKAVEAGEIDPAGGYGSGRQKQSVGKFIRSNTPQDVFHYTPDAELGFTVFDPDKAPSALDALGTHVGSPKAARDRFKALRPGQDRFATGNLGYDEAGIPIPRTTFGGTYPLKADLSKPYTPKGKAGSRVKDVDVWDEEGINMHLLIEYNKDRFGDAYSPKAFDMGHLVGDKPNFPFDDFRKFIGEFRKKLAEEGFTHLPYYNAVEDAGSLSYVMLTDRPKGSKAVLKGKFGKNDPRERTNPDIMKEDGGVISLKDKAVNMARGPQGIEPFIKFMV